MGKIGIIGAVLVWIFMGVRIIESQMEASQNIIQAFQNIDYYKNDTIIDASGDITKYGDNTDKKSLAVRIAAGLGIDNLVQQKEDGCVYVRESRNASIKISISELSQGVATYFEPTTHIQVRLVIKNRVDCALTYFNLLREVLHSEGIDCDVSLNLRGEIKGAANIYERDRIADIMLKSLDARTIYSNRAANNYAVYAYTDAIEDYTVSYGDKINISVTEVYDELQNATVVYLSTPFCNLDY